MRGNMACADLHVALCCCHGVRGCLCAGHAGGPCVGDRHSAPHAWAPSETQALTAAAAHTKCAAGMQLDPPHLESSPASVPMVSHALPVTAAVNNTTTIYKVTVVGRAKGNAAVSFIACCGSGNFI